MENNDLKINIIKLTLEAESYMLLINAFLPLTENDGRNWLMHGDIDMLKLAFTGLLLDCEDREKLDLIYKFLLNSSDEESYEDDLSDEVKAELDRRLEMLEKGEVKLYDPFEVMHEIEKEFAA